jgi:hypothetical protein
LGAWHEGTGIPGDSIRFSIAEFEMVMLPLQVVLWAQALVMDMVLYEVSYKDSLFNDIIFKV